MERRQLLAAFCAGTLAMGMSLPVTATAQDDTVKVGLILSMTGPFASTGKQLEQGARLFIAQHGDKVAGKKIELIIKDDTGAPDHSRRVAQELAVQDKVDVMGGFVLTPLALSAAQVATRSKTPTLVMVAATSSVIDASPYFVRSSFTLPQVTIGIAEWAPANDIKNVVTLVSDYGPGVDAEKAFIQRFEQKGGKVLEAIRVPVQNPDFAPFLQRVKDLKPEAVFTFLPAGVGTQFMKQFSDRGLSEAGVKLLATGDVVEDDILNGMGDVALNVVSSHHYSAAHPSEANKQFVSMFKEAYNRRPNYMAVAAYDGMRILYNALEATGGKTGDELLEAMKGQKFESPRGPIQIDAQTRDIVQDVYIRRVQKLEDGELYNVEFDVLKEVHDPRRQ